MSQALVAGGTGLFATTANAQDVSWVGWTATDQAGPYVVSGQDGMSGLSVSAVFNARSTASWSQATAAITDPAWGFGTIDTSFWSIYETGSYQSTMTIDFLSAGGFASGGSLSIVDLENADSSVSVAGYRWNGSSFQEVEVNWVVSSFHIAPTSVAAVWNSANRTLTGSGTFIGGFSTLSVLSSDTQLDRIVLNIALPSFDGIGIGITQTNVGAATVPAGGVGVLFGLLGTTRRRARES